MRPRRARRIGTPQSLRREVEGPGKHEGDGEAQAEHDDDRAHHPVRDVEEGKGLCRHLDHQPGHDQIGGGNLVYAAPFQLGKEIAELHAGLAARRRAAIVGRERRSDSDAFMITRLDVGYGGRSRRDWP